VPVCVSQKLLIIFETLRSPSLAAPALVRKILADLTSRCIILILCRVCNARVILILDVLPVVKLAKFKPQKNIISVSFWQLSHVANLHCLHIRELNTDNPSRRMSTYILLCFHVGLKPGSWLSWVHSHDPVCLDSIFWFFWGRRFARRSVF